MHVVHAPGNVVLKRLAYCGGKSIQPHASFDDAAVDGFWTVFNQTPSTSMDMAASASGSSALILLAI